MLLSEFVEQQPVETFIWPSGNSMFQLSMDVYFQEAINEILVTIDDL